MPRLSSEELRKAPPSVEAAPTWHSCPGRAGSAGGSGQAARPYLQDGGRVQVHEAHLRQDGLPDRSVRLSVHDVLEEQISRYIPSGFLQWEGEASHRC